MTFATVRLLLIAGLGATIGCGDKDDTATEECDTTSTYYADADGDGFGVEDDTVEGCESPEGYAAKKNDCDDTDPAINPRADEVCNEIDDDCDDEVDEDAVDGVTGYEDADGDGYGADDSVTGFCTLPSGWITEGGDCDDADAAVNPAAEEVCNGVDDDCDALVDADDDVPTQTWYVDADGDGYGLSSNHISAACPGDGYALEGTDCDDTDPAISPGAAEVWYDGVDQNCDGRSDYDQDGDRYTAEAYGGSDCDDTDNTVNPAADDTWYDGVDQDCDEASDYDQDYDGYDHADYGGDDCDDTDSSIHPDQPDDDGDGIDDDCSGAADDDFALGDAPATFAGEAANDYAGQVLSGFGDVDGDGYGDFVAGVPARGSSLGTVYIVLGEAYSGASSLGLGGVIITGASSSMQFGSSVALVGDVDGDGYDDVLAGAIGSGTMVGTAGDAYLFLGGPDLPGSSLSSADADTILAGTASAAQTGFRVAGVGDLTGDGLPDMLVSAPNHTVRRGATYLVSDPATGIVSLSNAVHTWMGDAADDYAGSALAGAGDVDGDGMDDVLIGSYLSDHGGADAGAAYLVLGPGTGITDLEDADGIAFGITAGDKAAYALDGVGDTNHDGYDDLLIGAYQRDGVYTNSGAAYLLLGPFSGELELNYADATFAGTNDNACLGAAVARAGDVDDDGNDDFLIGAYGENSHGSNSGAAYLVLGPVAGSYDVDLAAIEALGESSGNYAGVGVAGAGDIDGDGSLDFLVGAKGVSSNAGMVYLMLGPWP